MVAVLFSAGDHVPLIPLVDVVGKGLKVAPAQTGATGAKVGVVLLFTAMVMVAMVAHCPAVGVNVYVVVAVLFSAGAQVPLIPFVDVVGKGLRVAPAQIELTWVKAGVIRGLTVMVIWAGLAHCVVSGIKV